MSDLEKLNFTELSASEMKQVCGGGVGINGYINDVLKLFGGNIDAAAAYLDMTVEELRRLLGL